MTIVEMLLAAAIGFSAGVLGGLAGIGGSMIILPGLALVFRFRTPDFAEQHLYMAAAMATNVLVALPAASRHNKAGTVRRELVIAILPAMVIAMIAGVLISNYMPGQTLKRLLAIFIAIYALINLHRMVRRRSEVDRPPEHVGPLMLGGIGGISGLFGGLLGIGGGVVMVPLLQIFSRVRLREAIGVSSAVMVASALVGAALKFATLSTHGQSPAYAALFVLAMAPTAMIGATLGASLIHRLPLQLVRAVVSVLLLIAAVRMSGIF